MSIPISQFTPPPLSTLVSIRLLSTSLCLCFKNAVFVHLFDLEFTPFRLCVLASIAVITNDQAFRSLNHTNQLLWVSICQKSDAHLVGLTLGVSRSVLFPGSLGRPRPLFFQLIGRILSLAVAGTCRHFPADCQLRAVPSIWGLLFTLSSGPFLPLISHNHGLRPVWSPFPISCLSPTLLLPSSAFQELMRLDRVHF